MRIDIDTNTMSPRDVAVLRAIVGALEEPTAPRETMSASEYVRGLDAGAVATLSAAVDARAVADKMIAQHFGRVERGVPGAATAAWSAGACETVSVDDNPATGCADAAGWTGSVPLTPPLPSAPIGTRASGFADRIERDGVLFSGGAILTNENVSVVATPNAAALFSAGAPTLPNVHALTPIPPPSPLPSLPTSVPQSAAATIGSLPPPPPPVPAPAAASGVAPTTSGVQTDSAGLPWDARIHASTRATVASGEWKKRRGVDPATVVEVEAQLRGAMAVPVRPPAAAWPFPSDSSAVTGAPTFATLMAFITPRMSAGTLNQAQVTAAVQSVGLESLNLVMARTDLIPAIMDALRAVAP